MGNNKAHLAEAEQQECVDKVASSRGQEVGGQELDGHARPGARRAGGGAGLATHAPLWRRGNSRTAAAGKQQGSGEAPDPAILSLDSDGEARTDTGGGGASIPIHGGAGASEATPVDLVVGSRSQMRGGVFSWCKTAVGGRIEAGGGGIGGEAGTAHGREWSSTWRLVRARGS